MKGLARKELIANLPKTETHLHVEGALPWEMLRDAYPDIQLSHNIPCHSRGVRGRAEGEEARRDARETRRRRARAGRRLLRARRRRRGRGGAEGCEAQADAGAPRGGRPRAERLKTSM